MYTNIYDIKYYCYKHNITILGGLFIIVKKIIIGPEMPTGFPYILASILFSSGIIMILLGVIDEYVGRIYISINSAPQFVINNKINFDNEKMKIINASWENEI